MGFQCLATWALALQCWIRLSWPDGNGTHPGRCAPSITCWTMRRRPNLLPALAQNFIGQIIVNLGVVLEPFKVGVLKHLCAIVMQLGMDGLPHAWIAQFPLSCGLARDELVNRISQRPVACIRRRNDVGKLARLELADGVINNWN